MIKLPEKLAEIKARAEKATAGLRFHASSDDTTVNEVFSQVEQQLSICRSELPALLAVIEKLIEQRDYVADYPIEGPADIERFDAELLVILEKGE
jgi:hypothetical protein